jgi:putative two-component system response regulator
MEAADKAEAKVLCIDDEILVRHTIVAYLKRRGFQLIEAEDGESGLEKFIRYNPDIVLVDLKMPGISGLDVLAKIARMSPETPVVIISGAGIMQDAVEAIGLGAWDFITKPIQDLPLLEHTVRKELERASLMRENRKYREYLEEEIKLRTVELQKELRERKNAQKALKQTVETLEQVTEGTISAFSHIGEMRDPYTAGHQRRVSQLARGLAQELGMSEDESQGIGVAGMLHDIGKIRVPAEILNKPGRLTQIEMNLIKTHTEVGYDILMPILFPWPVAKMVLQHHERQDGSGYPRGMEGSDILAQARIIAVADTVEAMSFHRPYRPALGMEVALDEIETGRLVRYDADVVDACLSLFRESRFRFNKTTYDGESI